jgi:hypothetical protein
MVTSENSLSGAKYVVRFNPAIAWTLTYDDSLGQLVFVFESGETPQIINLDPIPLKNNRIVFARDAATQARLDLAFQRTKAFLVDCGYHVSACRSKRRKEEKKNRGSE